MRKTIKQWVQNCIACQKSKIQRHTRSALKKYSAPNERFEHVNIDIVGPLPPSGNFKYILTMIDRFSRWPEAAPMIDQTAATVAKTIIETWVSRFGCPAKITVDRGGQFKSELFNQLNMAIGCKHFRTTSYHPQSNGIIERWHRTLKASLMCQQTASWAYSLPTVLLGLRTVHKDDIDASPAEMLYGQTLRLPAELFDEIKINPKPNNENDFISNFRESMRQIKPTTTAHHSKEKPFVHKSLADSKYVFIRNDKVKSPLTAPFDGPYKVLERREKFFKLDINGKTNTVSIDRLKPAFVPAFQEEEPATNYRPRTSESPTGSSKKPSIESSPKPLIESSPKPAPNLTQRTRSGRKVRFPARYQ